MIDYVDGASRLIYLDASTVNASIHPVDIYKELRTLRRTDESLRKFNNFMKADGNVEKGGGKYTERYFTLLEGARIVPYDVTHVLSITGTIITDDGYEGVFAFNRLPLSVGVQVDIQYIPVQVEVITVATGSAVTEQDKLDIATEVWESVTRTLTSGGSGGLDEAELHTALDTYSNKDDWKATTATVNLQPVLDAIDALNDVTASEVRSAFNAAEFSDKNTEAEVHAWLDSYGSKDDWKAVPPTAEEITDDVWSKVV